MTIRELDEVRKCLNKYFKNKQENQTPILKELNNSILVRKNSQFSQNSPQFINVLRIIKIRL